MATEAAFAAVPQASDPEASEATSPAEAVTLASADEEQTEHTPALTDQPNNVAGSGAVQVKETKVIYHIDEEETPYLVKIVQDGDDVSGPVRLKDFKNVLPSHLQRYKFFFKSQDDDFGVVKEEISLEDSPLPLFNGRVVSWLVQAEGSVIMSERGVGGGGGNDVTDSSETDGGSTAVSSSATSYQPPPFDRSSGVGTTRPPSFHSNHRLSNRENRNSHHRASGHNMMPPPPDASTTTDVTGGDGLDTTTAFDDTESSITSVSQIGQRHHHLRHHQQQRHGGHRNSGSGGHHRPPRLPGPGISGPPGVVPGASASVVGGATTTTATETSSMMSSEIESSVYDDEDEDLNSLASSSRFTTSTEHTSVSRNLARQQARHKQRSRRQRKIPAHLQGRADSVSSVTDSTMSLNIITVTLNMDTVNFLGISIVGQSNKFGDGGDCGIYVGSIMEGGAVALDGRIEPGDMILQVNETNFENMSNDDAVRVLREVVQKPGPIRLVVAKCWDPNPGQGGGGGGGAKGGQADGRGGFLTMPRAEPVRPIDPGAWVAHTAAVRALDPPLPPESFVAESRPRGVGDPSLCMTNPANARNRDLILLGDYPGRAPSVTTLSASSIVSSQPETEKYFPQPHLARPPRLPMAGGGVVNYPPDGGQLPGDPSGGGGMMLGGPGGMIPPPPGGQASEVLEGGILSKNSGMLAVTRAMRAPDSGLEVRDRMWLKIKIPNAFLGSDVVDWLYEKVEGFEDRREARKFACQLLKTGLVKHTVNKTTFSEQCYYAFGDEATIAGLSDLSKLTLNDSRDSNETAGSGGFGVSNPHAPLLRHQGHPPTLQPPMVSNGSNGSTGDPAGQGTGGIWGAGPTTAAAASVMPPAHQSPSGGSTYCGGQTIYNPAAPPPSANYSAMPYQPGGVGGGTGSGGALDTTTNSSMMFHQQPHQQRTVSSSGSSHPSQRGGVEGVGGAANLRLAGSGSGSESDVGGGGGGVVVSNRPMTTAGFRTAGVVPHSPAPVLRPVPLPVVGGLAGGGGSSGHSSGIL